MSLKNIKLTPIIIAGLYRNSLLQKMNSPDLKLPEREPALKYLGGNLRKTVFLVSHLQCQYLPEHHLQFLIRILSACKMNLGDVAILNYSNSHPDITQLKKSLEPLRLILCGIEPASLNIPFEFPQFKLQEFDHCVYLSIPSFDNLNQENEEGKLLKTRLWGCLKEMFEV